MEEELLNRDPRLPKYDFSDSIADKIVKDKSMPLWYRILNLDSSNFELSKSAGIHNISARIKDLGVLRKLAPNVYESGIREVKEFNEYHAWDGKKIKKLPLGKKVGSIPILDWAYHPELQFDEKAQDKYFQDHPEYRNMK